MHNLILQSESVEMNAENVAGTAIQCSSATDSGFLKVLYDQLRHKDRIHLRSQVDRIEPIEGGVQVTTKDHRSYKGDRHLDRSRRYPQQRRARDTLDCRHHCSGVS